MLNNLAGIYGRDGDTFRSLEVLERIAVLDPADTRIARRSNASAAWSPR